MTDITGIDEVNKMLANMPKTAGNEFRVELQNWLFKNQKDIQSRIKNGAGNSLNTRTGDAHRSIRYKTSKNNNMQVSGTIFTTSKYLPSHETGATIRAKDKYKHLSGGPFLNIPSSQNKTASGVMRYNAWDVFRDGGYTIPINAKKAKHAVFSKDGTPMFWLVKEIKLKKRLGFMSTVEKNVPLILVLFDSALKRTFNRYED